MKTLDLVLKNTDANNARLYDAWKSEVQAIANRHQVIIATGHLSDLWQVSADGGKTWLHQSYDTHPAIEDLNELDEKTEGYGVGPSNMERFEPQSEYDQQAADFLERHNLKFRATLSDSKTPQWGDDGKHGHHYRVTISKRISTGIHGGECFCMNCTKPVRLVFDFWSSIADMEAGIQTVTPYSVLASISGEIYCPDTFRDFCAEYGYETDSIKALQTFRRCSAFAKRLRAFFTEKEQRELSEIQ